MEFAQIYNEFQWFFSLGYVIVISTIVSMLLVQLWKVTILKKALANCSDAKEKDAKLSLVGTITSLIVYCLVYLANEMIIQRTFFIEFNKVISGMSIPSGAMITWVAAKGLYTVIHKFLGRIKDKKLTKEELEDTKKDIDEVKKAVEAEQANPTTSKKLIGSIAKSSKSSVPKVNAPAKDNHGTKKIL